MLGLAEQVRIRIILFGDTRCTFGPCYTAPNDCQFSRKDRMAVQHEHVHSMFFAFRKAGPSPRCDVSLLADAPDGYFLPFLAVPVTGKLVTIID